MEDIFPMLLELEAHGFDVSTVRNHVMKLLVAVDTNEELEHETSHIKKEIAEHEDKKSSIEKDIGPIQDNLKKPTWIKSLSN